MPWPIYLALKQLFPTGRWFSFLTLISVVGIGLGVAVLLVTTSVMGGFGHQVKMMIIDTQGEVQITGRGTLKMTEALEKSIASVPEVKAFAPFAHGVVMLEFEHRPAFPAVQGFDIARMKQVIPLERYITQGSLDDLDDDSVILSIGLANGLGVRIGDKVSVYSPLMLERMKQNEVLLPREVRVAGIFLIGHQELDKSTVICSLRLMQDLYGLNQLVHGYNVRLKPGSDEFAVTDQLNREFPAGVRALSWYESNAEFQSILRFERNLFIILMSLIVLVAAFAIMGLLLATVLRKTREIGLLAAMGGGAGHIALCFCTQGLILGILGTSGGLAVGSIILHYRNEIIRIVNRISVSRESFERFYHFSDFPSHTTTNDVVLIAVFSLLASILAGLIPAWRASQLKPVEALRSE